MIELKVDEETQNECLKMNYTKEEEQQIKDAFMAAQPLKEIAVVSDDVVKELHTLNVTLKEILREMKKRKV